MTIIVSKSLSQVYCCPKELGGISITFDGPSMAVGADIIISGHHGYGNIDIPVSSNSTYKSNIANAVWWEPKRSRSYLVLGNSSASPIDVTMSYGSAQPVEFTIAPHATNVQETHGDGPDERPAMINSVHIAGKGDPGILRVTGYTISDDEKLISTIHSFGPCFQHRSSALC